MSDRPPDFDDDLDDDLDMGEPITDKLNVLLEELSDEWRREDGEVDLGEPVTDKLNVLLSALPADWDRDDDGVDMVEPVTDRLTEIFKETAGEARSARVREAAELGRSRSASPSTRPPGPGASLLAFVKRLFGRR